MDQSAHGDEAISDKMRDIPEENQTLCPTSNEPENSTQPQTSVAHAAPTAVPEWLIPISPTANLNTACSECQDRMLRVASAGTIDPFTIKEDSSCTICCMLHAKEEGLAIWSCIDMGQILQEGAIQVKKFFVVVENESHGMSSRFSIRPLQDEVADLSIHSKDQEAVHPRKVNFENLKAKLSCCLEGHGTHCDAKEKSYIQDLHVINCKTRMIELAKDETEYVALSYVWGKYGPSDNDDSENGVGASEKPTVLNEADAFTQRQPTNNKTTFPRELPRKMELTIEDAIRVTLEMGFSYLWVDKYCIDQNNPEQKTRHIRNMDSIYQDAAFTIIAAAGEGASHGLPGVSTRPRTSRTSCRVANFLVLSGSLHNGVETEYRPNQTDVLSQSKWNSRAWTYQEGVLSRRCLVFTDEQASFACRIVHVADGAETRPTPGFSLAKKLDSGFLWKEIAAVGIGSRPAEIGSRLYEYSQRHLTRPEDIINAFAGILRAFEKMDPPTYHFWGVPILFPEGGTRGSDGESRAVNVNRPSCDGFIRGLSWKTNSPSVRRRGFPSWSWAGSSGGKGVLPGSNLEDSCTDSEPVRVYVELADGTIRSWNEIEKRRYLTDAPGSLSRFLWLDAWTIQIKITVQKAKQASLGTVDRLFASYVDDSGRGVEVEGYDRDFLELVKSRARKQRIFTSFIPGSLSWSHLHAIVVREVDGVAERGGIFPVGRLWHNTKIPMERLERRLIRLG